MVEMVHALTGVTMYVHESKVAEYLAAGHRLAAEPAAEEKPAKRKKKKED